MTRDAGLELTLEFHLSADPVAGVVRDRAGGGEPFSGWMALTRAIETALDSARRRDTHTETQECSDDA